MRPAAVLSRTSSVRLQPAHSFDDEPVVALEIADRGDALGAVNLVEVAEEVGLAIGRLAETIERTRKLLARCRLDEVRRDDDDQLAFLLHEIAAAEERAQDGKVLEAGEAVDVLADAVGDEAGQRQRSAGRQLDRRVR